MILESGQYAIILRKIIHLSVRSLSHRKFLCLTRKISQNSKLEDYVSSPEVHRNARHILGSSIWYYTIISNLVSFASKVLLHHRNNIPKPKLSTWKLVSPVVRNSILKLAFEVKQPKKTKIMHPNFSNSNWSLVWNVCSLVARNNLFIYQRQLLVIASKEAGTRKSWYLRHSIYKQKVIFLTAGHKLKFEFLPVCDSYK